MGILIEYIISTILSTLFYLWRYQDDYSWDTWAMVVLAGYVGWTIGIMIW